MERVFAYRKYWRRHPPADMLVAAYVGYKPPPELDHKSQPPLVELPDIEE